MNRIFPIFISCVLFAQINVMSLPTRDIQDALFYERKGDIDKAKIIYQKLLEKNPKNRQAYQRLKEILKRTNFRYSKIGEKINLEKSLKFGERISGHFVQGHVDTTSQIKSIKKVGKSLVINFQLSKKYKKYIVEKGSISINGVSLTISKILPNAFEITVIPKTLQLTNLIEFKKKDIVNIEFDIFGKYIKGFVNKK